MDKIIERFFQLAETAARNGGFWVSAGGGSHRVVAGEIARATGSDFEAACEAVSAAGRARWGTFWYTELAGLSGTMDVPDWDELRFDVRTIVRAAIRSVH